MYDRTDVKRVAFQVKYLNQMVIIEWAKKFGDRLKTYESGANNPVVEIEGISYHEFIELFMKFQEYISWGRASILYRDSMDKYRTQLPMPRVEVYVFCVDSRY